MVRRRKGTGLLRARLPNTTSPVPFESRPKVLARVDLMRGSSPAGISRPQRQMPDRDADLRFSPCCGKCPDRTFEPPSHQDHQGIATSELCAAEPSAPTGP